MNPVDTLKVTDGGLVVTFDRSHRFPGYWRLTVLLLDKDNNTIAEQDYEPLLPSGGFCIPFKVIEVAHNLAGFPEDNENQQGPAPGSSSAG